MSIKITRHNFQEEVINSKVPVLVDFWAPWCGPCKMASPVVDELSNDTSGVVKVCKINIDEEIDLAKKYSVLTIPTMLVMHNGEEKSRSIGFKTKPELLKMLEL